MVERTARPAPLALDARACLLEHAEALCQAHVSDNSNSLDAAMTAVKSTRGKINLLLKIPK
jgi:hypothetical protein